MDLELNAERCRVANEDHSKFMELPTDEVQRQCFQKFQDATSNKALAMSVCVVYAQQMMACEGQKLFILSIPNIRQKLSPAIIHSSYDLWDGILLVKHGIEGEGPAALAWNIANDPYGAANINVTKDRVHTTMGILGRISAYFGVVEAQGHGMLHVHMLLWFEDAPNCDEMHKFLKMEVF
ncbi:hypothetical protein BDR07DRAFT_1378337 [Suillus spraguei]|nr:hypothetical protein BDR07DRAFT_1378337 [Suillus spraguei]